MKKNLNLILATCLALSGAVMSFIGFYAEPKGEISNSVLWYFAQTLLYTGTAFGMKEYVNYWKHKAEGGENNEEKF